MDISPFSSPLYLLVKPAGSRCNLACKYCYYLEKAKLYADSPQEVMSDELLEKFIHDYIAAQTMPQVLFTWHGGETLMRPLSFYKRVVELQKNMPMVTPLITVFKPMVHCSPMSGVSSFVAKLVGRCKHRWTSRVSR